MKVIMDMRKYDGVIGGVEQGAIQITRNAVARGHCVTVVCKQRRHARLSDFLGDMDGLKVVPLPVTSHGMSLKNARIDSVTLQDLAAQEKADLIHFFYNWSFPFKRKVPCILTVHDVIPFTFREAMGWFRNVFLYRSAMRTACRLNDVIVTVSDFSREDIAAKVGVPLAKIKVVPNGLRTPAGPDPALEQELNRRFKLSGGYILNVGGIHERKNVPRLISAFAQLSRETGYKGSLLVTGSVSGAPYQERMKVVCDAAARESGIASRIVFTGFVSDEELDTLLRNADVFVYPSLYEGFGIPILEAMKLDTPVVCSNVTAMPEVAGDAAVLVDPLNVDDISDGMAQVLSDAELRAGLVERGRRRSSHYSWNRNCEEYLEIYEQASRG